MKFTNNYDDMMTARQELADQFNELVADSLDAAFPRLPEDIRARILEMLHRHPENNLVWWNNQHFGELRLQTIDPAALQRTIAFALQTARYYEYHGTLDGDDCPVQGGF